MSFEEELIQRVRQLLAGEKAVEEKRMFRGTAFMVNGKMCVTTGKTGLMCRFDPDRAEELLQMPGCQPMKMKGRAVKGYVIIDPDFLQSRKQIAFWVEVALAFNQLMTKSHKSSVKQKKSK